MRSPEQAQERSNQDGKERKNKRDCARKELEDKGGG